MQKGFATIEIILVAAIISILMTLTIPNAARLVDRAALDYEYKRLYSELRYLQTVSRSEDFSTEGVKITGLPTPNPPTMEIFAPLRRYKIVLSNDSTLVRDEYQMSPNVTSLTTPENRIFIDSNGQFKKMNNKVLIGSIILQSRFGKANRIVFDSVGRIRGGRADD